MKAHSMIPVVKKYGKSTFGHVLGRSIAVSSTAPDCINIISRDSFGEHSTYPRKKKNIASKIRVVKHEFNDLRSGTNG
jgi:hypothetical protein